MLVVGVSMIKEAREDYKRYKQDREVNERPTRVLDRKTGACARACLKEMTQKRVAGELGAGGRGMAALWVVARPRRVGVLVSFCYACLGRGVTGRQAVRALDPL